MAYIGNTPAELVTELDNGVVTTAKLADDAVTAAKIIDGTIISDDLNDGIITNAKVSATAAIAASKLAISGGSNITLQSDGTFDLNNTIDITGAYQQNGTNVITSSGGFRVPNGQDLRVGNAASNTGKLQIYLGNTTAYRLDVFGTTTAREVLFQGSSSGGKYNFRFKNEGSGGADIDISNGGLQIGGTTTIDSSRVGSLESLSVGTTNTSAQLVVGDDTDTTATLLQLRNDDATYSQSWTFSSDTSKDLVITGASGTGGVKFAPGSRGVDVNSGPLKIGGSTAIDSNRNYTGPYFASSSNVNQSGDSGLQMYTDRRLGFDESGVRSWNLKATGGSLAVTSGDGNGGFDIAGPEFKMGGTTVLEQDRDLVNIRSFSIVGDATSGGQKNKFAQPGTGGSSYSIMTTNNNNGSLSGGKFAILDDNVSGNNAAQARFVINSSGQIGIGQAAPAERLHVGDGNASFIRVHNAASGDISSGLSITRGPNVGFQLYDNPQDDTTTFNAAGNMNFRKHGVGTRFYLDTDGSVGIGTNNPQRMNTFGGTQNAFQITGTTVAEMRLTSSTSGQGDFAIYATNSGKTTWLVNNTSGPTVFANNGASGQKTLVMDSANRMYSEQTGWMGPIFTWWTASQSGTNDQVSIATSGGVMNLRNYGVGRGSTRGAYNALFHGGFFQKYSLEGALTSGWTEARIWVYGHPAIASHSDQTVDLDIVKWHYSTNWQTTALATIDSSVDPDRGGRLMCSTWFNIADGSNATDVPGMGIRNNDTTYAFEIGAVFIQFRG